MSEIEISNAASIAALIKATEIIGEDPTQGGDAPPTTTSQFIRFLDSNSDDVKSGEYPPNKYLDTGAGVTYDPPMLINPLYVQCSWREFPKHPDGKEMFGEAPSFVTFSYQEALDHFKKDDRGRSMEFFARNYYVFANFKLDGVCQPRIITLAKTAAQAVERMLSSSKTIVTEIDGEHIKMPLYGQWWELNIKDDVSKATGIKFRRQTLSYNGAITDIDELRASAAENARFDELGGFKALLGGTTTEA